MGYPPLLRPGSYPNGSHFQPWITWIDPALDGSQSGNRTTIPRREPGLDAVGMRYLRTGG